MFKHWWARAWALLSALFETLWPRSPSTARQRELARMRRASGSTHEPRRKRRARGKKPRREASADTTHDTTTHDPTPGTTPGTTHKATRGAAHEATHDAKRGATRGATHAGTPVAARDAMATAAPGDDAALRAALAALPVRRTQPAAPVRGAGAEPAARGQPSAGGRSRAAPAEAVHVPRAQPPAARSGEPAAAPADAPRAAPEAAQTPLAWEERARQEMERVQREWFAERQQRHALPPAPAAADRAGAARR